MKKIILLLVLCTSTLTNQLFAQATDVYVMEFFTNPGQFGTIPLAGPYYPIPNIITNNALTMLGGDFNASGSLYTFVYVAPDYVLGIVDLNTGAVNYAADVTGVVSSQQFMSQLSYNYIDGNYYAMSHDPNNRNGSQLYSLNESTGVLTPIGGLDTIANAIAFEIDNNGIAYAADSVTGNFYTLNLTTGEATMVGNMMPNGFYPVGQGFSIDRSNNTMYANLANSNGVIRSAFYTVNLATGALTLLGDGSSREYSLFAIQDPALGVNKFNLDAMSVYPNPASKYIHIANPNGTVIKNAVLFDIMGRKTGVSLINGELDVEGLSNGVYILNIETENGTLTKKIIKN